MRRAERAFDGARAHARSNRMRSAAVAVNRRRSGGRLRKAVSDDCLPAHDDAAAAALAAPVLTAKTWPLALSGSPRTAAYQGRSAVIVAGRKNATTMGRRGTLAAAFTAARSRLEVRRPGADSKRRKQSSHAPASTRYENPSQTRMFPVWPRWG